MPYICGFHAIEEYLEAGKGLISLHVSGKGPRIKKIISKAESRGIRICLCTKASLDDFSPGVDHRGILLEVSDSVKKEVRSVESLLEELDNRTESLIVVLDGITDPHNLGAIIRSCDLFAVDGVIIPARRSAGESATIEKTSAGAIRHVPLVQVNNLDRTLQLLKRKGYWVIGSDVSGEPLSEASVSGKAVVVMGSEGHGMGRLVKENCDLMVCIPTRGHIDSLNVSVAAGILLYEIRRQQWGF